MKWWKRLILSVISLVWGFVSVDYLYVAMGFLSGTRLHEGKAGMPQDFLWQLAGLGMLLLWIVVVAVYTEWIRRMSPRMDMVELDEKNGRPRIRRKLFDIVLQYALILTGMLIRWAYLCLVYFPHR